jgi:DNA anti-recombination protein RmuC
MVMKANKALKRIGKIEELASEVTRRLSKSAPHVSELLKDLKAAVIRVKDAVNAQVSSRTAKKKAAPPRKKAGAKKKSGKAPKAKTARKVARVKRTAKPAPAQTAPAPVNPAETFAQEVTTSN